MKRLVLLGIAAMPLVAIQQSSLANVIFSDGFENYTADPSGNLNGAGDYDPTGALPGWDVILEGGVVDGTSGAENTVKVMANSTNTPSKTGNNALWFQPLKQGAAMKYLPAAQQGTKTTIDFDVFTNAYQVGFEVDLDNAQTQALTTGNSVGGILSAVPGGAHTFQTWNGTSWSANYTDVANAMDYAAWNHVTIVADFTAQTYNVTVDGQSTGPVAFASTQSSIQRISFYSGSQTADSWGIDNVEVTSNLVPEPTSAAIVLLSLIPLLGHRRRRSA